MPPPTPGGLNAVGICPGEGLFTRSPGYLGGVRSVKGGPSGVMEWQIAQWAMFAYYYAYFKDKYPVASLVLAEGEYLRLLTGVETADHLLDVMAKEFRRDHARGGSLRPDIMGICCRPPIGNGLILIELLEVSTATQAVSTLRQDVQYKLAKAEQVTTSLHQQLREAFSLRSVAVKCQPATWKPELMQRIVPLPPRQVNGVEYVEWICFQPTFNRNWPNGIDGLLLYEVHSLPLRSNLIPEKAAKKLAEEERRQRRQAQVAYGMTLTPWLDQKYLDGNPVDRDALLLLAAAGGIALAVCLAFYLAPVIAGVELAGLLAGIGEAAGTAATGLAEVTAPAVSRLALGLGSTVSTAGQWMSALQRPVMVPAPAWQMGR